MSSQKSGWKSVLTVVTILALVGTAYFMRDQIAITIDNLQEADPWPILLIIPLALVNHLFQGKIYQGLFRVLGARFRTKSMVRLSLELNFVNSVFPSAGVSGFSYLSLRMKDEDISTAKSTIVQVMRFTLIFVSFQAFLIIGLLLLALTGDANDLVLLIAGSLVTLLLTGTLLMIYVVGSRNRIDIFFTGLTRIINRVIHVVRPKHPETINIERARSVFFELHEHYKYVRGNLKQLGYPLLFAGLATLTEVLAIYATFVAFGQIINPGAVIIAYAVANFAGLISVLPGGVGIYEALMTAVFATAGVPASLSLPVILCYRIVSMAVQLPIGFFYYNRALHYQRPLETVK